VTVHPRSPRGKKRKEAGRERGRGRVVEGTRGTQGSKGARENARRRGREEDQRGGEHGRPPTSGDGKVSGSTFPKRRWRLNLTARRYDAARDPASRSRP